MSSRFRASELVIGRTLPEQHNGQELTGRRTTLTLRNHRFNFAIALAVATGVLTLLAILGGPMTGDASAATAGAAKSCGLSASEGRKLGASYVMSLKVTNVSCSKGKSVAKAFNACRRSHGGAKGRCPSKVSGGYKCSESRSTIPSQISSKVSCKRGSKKVSFRYQQFT
jgi:hypothetical protein